MKLPPLGNRNTVLRVNVIICCAEIQTEFHFIKDDKTINFRNVLIMKNMNPEGCKIMAKEEIIGSKTFEQQPIKPNINSLSKRYKILYN